MYSIGDLRDPRPEDQRVETEQEAWKVAKQQSFPDRVMGIWRDEDGELLAIAYDGLVYWP